MDMGKYVAVGVLAVIVLAAVTYEAPKEGQTGAVTTEAGGDAVRVEGAFGALTPPAPVREPAAATPAPVPSAAPTTTPTPAPTGGATTLPVSAPKDDVLSYTLKSGQTLRDAAQELLGDRGRWKELYEANKDKIPDPNRVRAGLTLIFSRSAERSTPASAPRATTRDHELPAQLPPGGRYTVKSGDTLYSIARRELGNGNRWREIKQLNNLGSETVVPGSVLVLPAR